MESTRGRRGFDGRFCKMCGSECEWELVGCEIVFDLCSGQVNKVRMNCWEAYLVKHVVLLPNCRCLELMSASSVAAWGRVNVNLPGSNFR